MRIFVINPGSTSSKFAVFEEEVKAASGTVSYSREALKSYRSIYDQLELRIEGMFQFLREKGIDPESLDAVAARGGMMPPLKAGAYKVDENLCHVTRYEPAGLHASNLGALMAHELSKKYDIPAYIYDAVSTDEMIPEARLSGIKTWPRKAFSHALNTRAMARRYAASKGKRIEDLTLICAHLGGGISLNLQHRGRMIDTVAGQEGPFSTERAGALDCFDCADIAEKEGIDQLRRYQIGDGGFVSYLGTNDARAVEEMVEKGNAEAREVMTAMGLQIAKYILQLAADVNGQVDGIILTGGMAYWDDLCKEVERRVSFLAPVTRYPGEVEMEALAEGVLRVLKGEEEAHQLDS